MTSTPPPPAVLRAMSTNDLLTWLSKVTDGTWALGSPHAAIELTLPDAQLVLPQLRHLSPLDETRTRLRVATSDGSLEVHLRYPVSWMAATVAHVAEEWFAQNSRLSPNGALAMQGEVMRRLRAGSFASAPARTTPVLLRLLCDRLGSIVELADADLFGTEVSALQALVDTLVPDGQLLKVARRLEED